MKKQGFLRRAFVITTGKSLYGLVYGLLSIAVGALLQYPFKFSYKVAVKAASPGAEHWFKAALIYAFFLGISCFVYIKGFKDIAKLIGTLAGLILFYPALGLLSGVQGLKDMDLLNTILILNGFLTVIISLASLMAVLLLSRLES